jgi:hypothetical protein
VSSSSRYKILFRGREIPGSREAERAPRRVKAPTRRT